MSRAAQTGITHHRTGADLQKEAMATSACANAELDYRSKSGPSRVGTEHVTRQRHTVCTTVMWRTLTLGEAAYVMADSAALIVLYCIVLHCIALHCSAAKCSA